MNTKNIYFTGLLIAVAVASAAAVTAQIGNETLNNTTLNPGNMSNINLTQPAVNNTALNTSATEEAKPSGNNSINASAGPFSLPSGQSHRIAFVIGEADGNNSAFNIGTPERPARDASKLWYLIWAVPHGYV
jgi:hypothetical protein